MKRITFFLTCILFTIQSHAGAGFWNTLFGDGDQEFVCYSRIHRGYYLAIFFSVVILAIIAYSRYRLKKRSAEKLEQQKNVIEEQNKDILDSIRYASRMQEALKPEQELIRKYLPESFFWLQPKDIVGGDFYFVEEHRGKIVIAAIDCTGHGVPGAFLTFIGHNALRHAVHKKGVNDASAILSEMNEEVKQTLGQGRSGNELNDGMEVALCIYDPASHTLDYCGAGSPLLLLQNGEINEIKAAKCTVGSIQEHVKEAPPTHRFKLNKGDAFYIGSDGIGDQFGGKEGKKFRRETLRNLVKESTYRNMKEQMQTITERILEWKGDHAQTDDMLLIGVRV